MGGWGVRGELKTTVNESFLKEIVSCKCFHRQALHNPNWPFDLLPVHLKGHIQFSASQVSAFLTRICSSAASDARGLFHSIITVF